MSPAADDVERIDRLRFLEQAKAAIAAAQMREAAAFTASQRRAQRDAGVKAERVGRGIAGQVGLAMRTSPAKASRFARAATMLTTELPHTMRALSAGLTSEWRALLVVRETEWLSPASRGEVDRQLAPQLTELGDAAVQREARRLAYRLEPEAFVARRAAAEAQRRVTIRPAPDGMSYVTQLLPVASGVGVWATLGRDADRLIASGDGRTRGQLMADLLVERVTGTSRASGFPVEIGLIMTDRALLHGDGEPAVLQGYGPIPAEQARALATAGTAPRWLRRLYAHPSSGQLIAMTSRRRFFTTAMRRFVTYRDQYCRTPYCGAPIRHVDHVEPAAGGGPTSVANGEGLCAACNLAKQAPGWLARSGVDAAGRPVVDLETPTGHRYRSRAPDPPGAGAVLSKVEARARAIIETRRAA